MISSIQFLDYDTCNLLEKYIKTKKKNNIVLNELKDNILFTTHINYYDKYFQSKNTHLNNMLNNKWDTINKIKNINDKQGWIVDFPTKFNWEISKNINISRKFKIENYRNNLILVDSSTGWKYRSYPPHSRHYNIKDLLKNIKL